MDHDRACHVITQPLALRADPRAKYAQSVSERHLIDEAHQIARHRVNCRDGLAGIFDYANVRQAFARRLPVPQRFEQNEISVHQEKSEENKNSCDPRPGKIRNASKHSARAITQADEQ